MLGPWSPQSHATDVDRVGLTKSLGQPPQSVDSWPMGEERQRTALFKSIAVAVDGSHASIHAFEFALGLARNFHASLALVTVVPTPPPYGAPFFPAETWDEICKAYSDELAKLEARARRHGVTRVTSECRQGIVVDQILEYLAQHPSDLLIVGARGLSASRRVVLGSVSDALVHDAACPVLVVREYVKPGA
ncbi:MAG: universal stress protein [Thermoplasmata archaeon]|nr:universal stress protein [Thermoplasmata archaeon]